MATAGAAIRQRGGQFALALVLLALGAAGFAWLSRPAEPLERRDASKTRPRVEVVRARAHAAARPWRGHGTIEPLREADVSAEITAPVARVPEGVEPGARVARGDTLVVLDQRDLELRRKELTHRIAQRTAELERLEAQRRHLERRLSLAEKQVGLLKKNLRRLRGLRERDAATEREVDDARRALARAQREAATARQRLAELKPRQRALRAARKADRAARERVKRDIERARIESPLAGVIDRVDVEPGEHVRAGERVARVVALDRVEARVRLPAAARGRIATGDPIRLSRRVSGATRKARIARIGPTDDARSRTLTVYAVLKQSEPPVWAPGAYVSAVARAAEPSERVLVPQVAARDGRLRLVKDGVVVGRSARIERIFESPFPDAPPRFRNWVSLTDPVAPGARVVVSAGHRLRPGDRVRPVKAEAAP